LQGSTHAQAGVRRSPSLGIRHDGLMVVRPSMVASRALCQLLFDSCTAGTYPESAAAAAAAAARPPRAARKFYCKLTVGGRMLGPAGLGLLLDRVACHGAARQFGSKPPGRADAEPESETRPASGLNVLPW
jgi:hypothetical protein